VAAETAALLIRSSNMPEATLDVIGNGGGDIFDTG
jgi:hypothetical protein